MSSSPVPDITALYQLARNGLERLKREPADTFLAFAALTFTHHLKDWWSDGDPSKAHVVVAQCPRAELIRGLVNGVKHMRPAASISHAGAFGVGTFGAGAFSITRLVVDDQGTQADLTDVIERALDWWADTIPITSASSAPPMP